MTMTINSPCPCSIVSIVYFKYVLDESIFEKMKVIKKMKENEEQKLTKIVS